MSPASGEREGVNERPRKRTNSGGNSAESTGTGTGTGTGSSGTVEISLVMSSPWEKMYPLRVLLEAQRRASSFGDRD